MVLERLLRRLLLGEASRLLDRLDQDDDPAACFDDEALEDMATLRELLWRRRRRSAAPELDVEVAVRLAWLLWYRYALLDTGTPEDLAEAVTLFALLHPGDPEAVPDVLRPLFGGGIPARGPEPAPDELPVLVACLLDLVAVAAGAEPDAAPEWWGYATALARHAVAVAGPPAPVDPAGDDGAARVALAAALVDCLDHAPDDDLLAAAGDLADSFEAAVLRGLVVGEPASTGAEPPGTVAEMRAALLRAVPPRTPPPTVDADVLETLADVRWYRYRFRDDADDDELPYALALYERLHPVDPAMLPPALVPLFDPAAAEVLEEEADLLAMLAWASDLFGYVEGGGVDRFGDYAAALAHRALALSDRPGLATPATRAALAEVLLDLVDRTGDRGPLDRAVAEARAALEQTPRPPPAGGGAAPPDPDLVVRSAVLGRALAFVADARGDERALQESLDVLRPIVRTADRDSPALGAAVSALIWALSIRHGRDTRLTVTAEIAEELRFVLELLPEDFPTRHLGRAVLLGAQAAHLSYAGDITGMRETARELEQVLALLPPGTELHDLYRLIAAQYPLLAAVQEQDPHVDAALARYRQVFDSTTALDPLDRLTFLDMLITMMMGSPTVTADPAALDECVAMLTAGLATVPAGSVEHLRAEATLGWVLTLRFQAADDRAGRASEANSAGGVGGVGGGDSAGGGGEAGSAGGVGDAGAADLRHAIDLLRRCLRDTEARDPDPTSRSVIRGSLGTALAVHYRATGKESSYREGLALLRANLHDPDHLPLGRWMDGREAGRLAAAAGDPATAADLLAECVALSSRLAWRGLGRFAQERNLALGVGTASDAAAAAARAGDPDRAVQLLEHGRAVLLHQVLDVRGDAARVQAELPDLARRLDELQEGIAGARDWQRRHDLAREWERVTAEIRAHPGLSRFLQPPEPASLRPAPGRTVAVVNVSDLGSDAFLVTAGGVRVLPLPALTPEEVERRVHGFQEALVTRTRRPPAGPAARSAAREVIDDALAWLWEGVAGPILDALGHRAPPPAGVSWPRVHWCPTGMLSFLPLHAAAAGEAGAVLDRVVSSYTPSLRALRFAGRRPDPPAALRSLLVVAMPRTPGLPPLPGARREAAALAGLPGTRVLTGAAADRAAVSAALREHAWAHFACHAAQDLQNPSRGRLYLHDHADHPFTVEDISALHLPYAQFAYLSACDTARGGLRLPDEALHLSGALQLAGYQHVIAALWSLSDTIAAAVTAEVYRRLAAEGGTALAPAGAATALHEAVRHLRARHPADPSLWAGYVHFGP